MTDPMDAPLADGTFTLASASAGTGKTSLVEAFVVRLVAERGIPIENILLITFTRAATAEMRSRVRSRLGSVLGALDAGANSPSADALVTRLRGLTSPSADEMVSRLHAALRDFDRAVISTIHGFSQRMLTEFAAEAGQDPGMTAVTEVDEILSDIVHDAMTTVATGASRDLFAALPSSLWSVSTLTDIAKEMLRPGDREIIPAVSKMEIGTLLADAGTALAPVIAEWDAAVALLASRDAIAFAKALQVMLPAKPVGAFRDYDGRQKPAERLAAWLSSGANAREPWGTDKASELLRKGVPHLEETWKGEGALKGALDLEVAANIAGAIAVIDAWPEKVGPNILRIVSAFAASVPDLYDAALRRRGLLPFEAMIRNLGLVFDTDGEPARTLGAALRGRFRAAIVDEFQDTDVAQWNTLRTAFIAPGSQLIAVGDPKQSIYSFRGAELAVFHGATTAGVVHAKLELGRNFRSDRPLVAAIEALWKKDVSDAEPIMGEAAPFVPVTPERPARLTWSAAASHRRPLHLRTFDGAIAGGLAKKWPEAEPAKQVLADCAAAEAAWLLGGGVATIEDGGAAGIARAVRPRDIAVLVRTKIQAECVRRAMHRRGVPATFADSGARVEATPAAEWILAWLDALDDFEREGPARRLALTPLVGLQPVALDDRETGDTEQPLAMLRGSLLRHLDRWNIAGFAKLFDDLLGRYDGWARILGAPSGERDGTDLRQLVSILDAEQRRSRLAPGPLAAHLRARREPGMRLAETDSDDGSAVELDNPGDAVRIVTIHGSKGLQYPIVLLPYAWHYGYPDPAFFAYTKPERGSLVRRVVFAMPKSALQAEAGRMCAAEHQREAARLLYVAMTRACHHVVAWVGWTERGGAVSPLLRLLTGSREVPTPAGLADTARALAVGFPGEISVEYALAMGPAGVPERNAEPAFRPWNSKYEKITGNWQKSSYSSLSNSRSAELESAVTDAMFAGVLADPAPGHALRGRGEEFGSFVHAVLENAAFLDAGPAPKDVRKDPDLPAMLGRIGVHHGVTDAGVHAEVAAQLPAWLDTPLHFDDGHRMRRWSPREGFRLRGLRSTDRRDELHFDLLLGRRAGGGSDREATRQLLGLIAGSALPEGLGESAKAWATKLLEMETAAKPGDPDEAPKLATLLNGMRGVLDGSIDLLFRTTCVDGELRYFVVDYKTNAIKGPDALQGRVRQRFEGSPVAKGANALLRNLHYTQPWMGWEMAHHAYHLQSLFYTLALHRLLASRIAGYAAGGATSYDRHVGGHLYLFLRGMGGANTPRDGGAALGVWADRWPFAHVNALDDALRGAAEEIGAGVPA